MVNFWVILSFLLVGNCLAPVQCSNGRLCSDGIECNEDGTRFCSTQACNQRSRRILQNELGKRSVEVSRLLDLNKYTITSCRKASFAIATCKWNTLWNVAIMGFLSRILKYAIKFITTIVFWTMDKKLLDVLNNVFAGKWFWALKNAKTLHVSLIANQA